MFFEGGVKVIDPGFDMLGGEDLTAYLKRDETSGDTFMRRAVMRGQRVEVTEKVGDRRRGSARAVTFLPESGDIRLAGYPEIIDGVQHKKLDSPTAVLALNKDTNEVHGRGGRATMTFTPNSRPPE